MSGASTDFLRIARVLKSYGTSGEILMGFREIGPEDLNHKEPVFIMFDGLPVPFFIESFQPKGASKALVRLTGMRNLEDAEEIAGRDVFARRSAFENLEDEDGGLTIDMLQGWTLLDDEGREIGTISDYEPIPGNPCLYIDTPGGSQVMVPLHDDLIVDIDEGNHKISLQIPEGLI